MAKRPILDHKMSFIRGYIRTPRTVFQNLRQISCFFCNGIQSVLGYCICRLLPSGDPLGASLGLKLFMWHILKTFKPNGPFQILDRAHRDIKPCLSNLLGVTPGTLEPFFQTLRQISSFFNGIWSVLFSNFNQKSNF